MARAIYESIVSVPNEDGLALLLADARITVYARDTTNPVTIYQRSTGVTQGPSPEAAAVGGPNPFLTGPSGSVMFWCENGKYDIKVEDATAPARFATRTIQWNAVPIDDVNAPITSAKIQDSAVTGPKILPDAVDANKILQATMASWFGWRKTLLYGSMMHGNHKASGLHVLSEMFGAVSGATGQGMDARPSLSTIDFAGMAISRLTPKFRLLCIAATNGTAPAMTFTYSLRAVSSVAGGASDYVITASGSATGNTAAIASPAANSIVEATSTEFDLPANGRYVLCVNVPSVPPSGSRVMLYSELQRRYI